MTPSLEGNMALTRNGICRCSLCGLSVCCADWSGIPDWEPSSDTLKEKADEQKCKTGPHPSALAALVSFKVWVRDSSCAAVICARARKSN